MIFEGTLLQVIENWMLGIPGYVLIFFVLSVAYGFYYAIDPIISFLSGIRTK